MNDAELMKVFYTRDDLLVELARLLFGEPLVFNYVVEELTSWDVLRYEIQLPWGFYNFI